MDYTGFQVGSYTILSPLGTGTACTTFLAADSGGKKAVVKRLADDLAHLEALFLAAGDSSSKIRMKKHIAVVLAKKKSDKGVFLAREYVDGTSLVDLQLQGKLQSIDFSRSSLHLCDGLHALASRGVVHGGIHPGNVFVQPDGTLRLTDFAVSRRALGGTLEANYALDALRYLAPEQWIDPGVQTASDIYSVGAVLFYLQQGRHWQEAVRFESLKSQVTRTQEIENPVLGAALAVDPKRRFADVEAFRDAVKRMLQPKEGRSEPAEAPVVPATPDTEPPRPTPQPAATPVATSTKQPPPKALETAPPRPLPPAPPPPRTPATLSAVTDVLTQRNLLGVAGPAISIALNGRSIQRPLSLANAGGEALDIMLSIHGKGASISPQKLHVSPQSAGSAIFKLSPEADGFANVIIEWTEAGIPRKLLLRVLPSK